MKRLIWVIICAVAAIVCSAQNNRVVVGAVFTSDGTPLKDAVLSPVGTDLKFHTNPDGTFQIQIPHQVREVEASLEGYFPRRVEVDGSYMVFKLAVDKMYFERKAKAKEQARQVAEKEAVAKVKAEEQARKAAAAKVKADSLAKVAALKKEARLVVIKKYNDEYRNKGLIHNFELNYSIPLNQHNRIAYENFGVRDYSVLHPMEFTYSLGYRFSNWMSLSLGAGLTYDLINLRNYGDVFSSEYYQEEVLNYSNMSIPVFVNAKCYMTMGKFQPMLSVSGGLYFSLPKTFACDMLLLDAGVGCNLRLNRNLNLYVVASIASVPVLYSRVGDGGALEMGSLVVDRTIAWAPRIKIGFTL